MRFCRNEVQSVSQGSWFTGLGNPQVNLIVCQWEEVSLEPGKTNFHTSSALFLH